MSEFLRLLLGLSLSGTLMALLLILLRRLFGHRLPSAFYYYAWLLVLLRFVLPLPGLMPGWNQSEAVVEAPLTASAAAESREAGPARPYNADSAHPGTVLTAGESAIPSHVEIAPAEGITPTEAESSASQTLFDLKQVLRSDRLWFSLWIIGMAVSALWYGGGYLRFRRELCATLKSAARSDRTVYARVTDEPCPKLYRSKAVSTPMLLGVLHPIIVIPDRIYSDTMLEGILAHEMTHYRRHDVIYKWFSVLVSVVHWFNPVTRLFRQELDRCCELACDECLLRGMNADEKQLYGDMLITLAAERRLPRSVVATSFAVEKQTLKERLVQIMTYKKRGRASLALVLAVMLLLSACGAAVGPNLPAQEAPLAAENSVSAVTLAGKSESADPVPTPEPAVPATTVTVSTVDAFLAAIGSDVQIFLEPGTYDLSTASDYGRELPDGNYTWRETYDGYELVIRNVEDLVIAGQPGESNAEILLAAIPRYANVLCFENSSRVTLSGFTAGHTEAPGQCAGGVLYFDGCQRMGVVDCSLYGCGILGVYAMNCRNVNVLATEIYDCSNGAVWAMGSRDVRIQDCDIHDCGKTFGMAFNLFQVYTSTGFAVVNCRISDNNANCFMNATSSDEVYLLGCEVEGNMLQQVFFFNAPSPVIDGCAFTNNSVESAWFESGKYAVSLDGTKLGKGELEAMERQDMTYDGPIVPQAAAVEGIPTQDGMEYHVNTVDELLAVIGSDTTVYLEGELFNLSTASNLGGYGGDHYYWVDLYDGPGLVITGVENFRLIGRGKDKTTVEVEPRYATVLVFENCSNVTVAALTAGHTKGEPGSCTGDVLAFEDCGDFHVIDCGLFGCGVWGIRSNNSVSGEVLRTEIYECSGGAAIINQSDGIVFTDCRVHDCVGDLWDDATGRLVRGNVGYISLGDSGDCSYNGAPLLNNTQTYVGEEPHVESADNTLSIRYYEVDLNNCTLRPGESVEVHAFDAASGSDVPAVWFTADENVISLQPTDDGRCAITALNPSRGDVVISASYGGMYAELRVYIPDNIRQ